MPTVARRATEYSHNKPAIIKVKITLGTHSEQVLNIIEQRKVQDSQSRGALETLYPRTLLMSQEDPQNEAMQGTILQRGS